jgi:hypothetical protein
LRKRITARHVRKQGVEPEIVDDPLGQDPVVQDLHLGADDLVLIEGAVGQGLAHIRAEGVFPAEQHQKP